MWKKYNRLLKKNQWASRRKKIDWTSAWGGKKYPILIQYQNEVNIPKYATRIDSMVKELMEEYQYSYLDAFLVLKEHTGKSVEGQ